MHQIIKSTNKSTTAKAETLNACHFVNRLKTSAYICFCVSFVVYIRQILTLAYLGNYNFENRKREKPPNISILYLFFAPSKIRVIHIFHYIK